MKRLLIATLGLSPGVVTGSYFSFIRDGIEIDNVITITTTNPAARQCEMLIWEALQGAENVPEYKPLRAVAARELKNSQVTEKFMTYIWKRLNEYGAEYEIYLVISGGRASMAAAAMLAVQKYVFQQPERANHLHMFHLEVLGPEFEEKGHIARLATMRQQDRQFYLDPPADMISLVEIPVLVQKDEPDALWARLFEYAAGIYLLEHEGFENVRYSFYPDYLRGQKGLGEVDVFALKPVDNLAEAIDKVDLYKLRIMLIQAFSIQEMQTLCSDLEINYEEIKWGTLSESARELVLYFKRHGRLMPLIEYCEEERTRYPWRSALSLQQVLLVECKLRTNDDPDKKPLEAGEVRKLINKMTAVHEETQRPVTGRVLSNSSFAEPKAIELAENHQVQLLHTRLPDNWKERVDWKIIAETSVQPWE